MFIAESRKPKLTVGIFSGGDDEKGLARCGGSVCGDVGE